MGYRLISSQDTVIVYSATNVADALTCSIVTTPSGAIVLRTIPRADFDADRGQALLSSLANAVESELQQDFVVAASGGQGIDAAGLLYDYVRFTVQYVADGGTPGEVTADVDVPVNVLTADTQFGAFLTGGSAAERITDTYHKLAAMASG
jgi:hypothetical protein